MLYSEIRIFYSEKHTKHINAMCGEECIIVCAFAKFPKETTNFVMSGHLSAWDISVSAGRICMKFYI
jgi:hypothetical protein